MMGSRFEQSDRKVGVLTLRGELTLEHAEELRSALIKALIKADKVVLNCGGAGRVDLAGLQLLCSAHKTSLRLKKRLIFDANGNKAVKEAAEQAGILRCQGCMQGTRTICLWIEHRK